MSLRFFIIKINCWDWKQFRVKPVSVSWKLFLMQKGRKWNKKHATVQVQWNSMKVTMLKCCVYGRCCNVEDCRSEKKCYNWNSLPIILDINVWVYCKISIEWTNYTEKTWIDIYAWIFNQISEKCFRNYVRSFGNCSSWSLPIIK